MQQVNKLNTKRYLYISKNKIVGVTEGNVIELDPNKIGNTFKEFFTTKVILHINSKKK